MLAMPTFSGAVSVGADGTNLDVSLTVDYVAMEGVNVTGLAQGQAKALSQQRSAGNIKCGFKRPDGKIS